MYPNFEKSGNVRFAASTSTPICFRWNYEAESDESRQRSSRILYLFPRNSPPDDCDLLELDERSPQHLFIQSTIAHFPRQPFAFVIPDRKGYVIRADYVRLRLRGLPHVQQAEGFTSSQYREVTGDVSSDPTVSSLLSIAIAGLILRVSSESREEASLINTISEEFSCRLCTPWITPTPQPRKRLALIDGRIYFPTSKHFYYAARALGISLVMLDRPNHYLQNATGPESKLREAFIAIDLTRDSTLPQRIVDAIKGYPDPIDAVVTICDPLLPFVAQANLLLGLPTNPPQAFEIAIDKHKTRLLDEETDQAFRISTSADLHARLASTAYPKLEYPLIIKPCSGNGSEGVVKVTCEPDLVSEVSQAFSRAPQGLQQNSDLVIESYVDGPEVDANLVLCDGDVIFCEIADDFPSTSDTIATTVQSGDALPTLNFLETQNVLPSALPPAEQALLKSQIHALLDKAGFRFGLYHCEARVKHSRTSYSLSPSSRTLDLQPTDNGVARHPDHEPRTFLVEINARTPGYIAAAATHITYGVDLFATVLLSAARDTQRLLAISQPFDFSRAAASLGSPKQRLRATQFHASILFIHPSFDTGSILLSDLNEVRVELARRRPELFGEDVILEWQPHFEKGDRVPGPASGELYWVLDCVVVCGGERAELLRMCEEVRGELARVVKMAPDGV
ncbi:hypothetical protein CC80DRAFT_490346 [Byssothecium circinans]|uniref:ATP-grasp domain-containing protein n=1 Tax=Byssothecium circinans TaxID=147558 RepID=A0A6A5U6E4_9PLEO|nr:hypothetical protein CC80DRAFT_490346 [Byssothecium circinans]